MQHGLREDEEVERVGEVVWVDGRVDGGIGGCEMHATAGEWVFEDSKHGEVVSGIESGVRAEEQTRVVIMLASCTAWKVDLLQACFFGVEELLEDEHIFLCLPWDVARGRRAEKRLWDRSEIGLI